MRTAFKQLKLAATILKFLFLMKLNSKFITFSTYFCGKWGDNKNLIALIKLTALSSLILTTKFWIKSKSFILISSCSMIRSFRSSIILRSVLEASVLTYYFVLVFLKRNWIWSEIWRIISIAKSPYDDLTRFNCIPSSSKVSLGIEID